MQRNIVFVTPPTTTITSISIDDYEWPHFGKYIDASSANRLSQDVKLHLLEVTNLYASSLRANASVKPLKQVLDRITDWTRRTSGMTRGVWTESKATAGHNFKKRSEDWTADFEAIQQEFLCAPLTKIESQFPLALLDRILTGCIETAKLVHHKLWIEAGASDDRKLWFLWAALVFSILREADIPVKHPRRENLLDGAVYLLARLQLKLPPELHLRKLTDNEELILGDIPDSFRKGAVIAFKLRTGNPTRTMQRMLARWVQGDFRRGVEMLDDKFLTRFDRLISA